MLHKQFSDRIKTKIVLYNTLNIYQPQDIAGRLHESNYGTNYKPRPLFHLITAMVDTVCDINVPYVYYQAIVVQDSIKIFR